MDRDDRDRSGRSQDARVESLWNSLDTQGKGQLDLEGLKRGLKKIDHPLQDADALVGDVHKAVDLNGDGRIEYNGASCIPSTLTAEDAEANSESIFRV